MKDIKSDVEAADNLVKSYQQLNDEISKLGGDAQSLPESLKALAVITIKSLHQATQSIAGSFNTLSGEVDQFKTANTNVDNEIKTYQDRLGPFWQSISQSMLAVENATGKVKGEWQSISDDLGNVVSGQIEITLPFLMGLEIQEAIKTWTMIQTETAAFAPVAPGSPGDMAHFTTVDPGHFGRDRAVHVLNPGKLLVATAVHAPPG